MTVPTEAAYAELIWTGGETSFTPGFSAENVNDVIVRYLDADDLPVTLTRGVHFNTSIDSALNVTVTPITLPVATALAPVTMIFERNTAAVQGTDFINLNRYNATVHGTLFDRTFRILAELKARVMRSVGPFFVSDDIVDFRPRRLMAADPVNDADVATRLWVLTVTGLLDIASSVAAAAASAASAAASAALALVRQTAAEAARDLAQLWANQTENTPVTTGPDKFSAFHWSQKSAASAALVLAALAVTDYGFIVDAPTESRDYGTIP